MVKGSTGAQQQVRPWFLCNALKNTLKKGRLQYYINFKALKGRCNKSGLDPIITYWWSIWQKGRLQYDIYFKALKGRCNKSALDPFIAFWWNFWQKRRLQYDIYFKAFKVRWKRSALDLYNVQKNTHEKGEITLWYKL